MAPPLVNEELLVPPLAIDSIPETKLEEARLIGPEERAPIELDWPTPSPREEKMGAELTVKLPPIPTFPVVDKVDSWVLPVTFKEDNRLTPEVTVKDWPIPTLPDTFKLLPI